MNASCIEVKDLPETDIRAELQARGVRRVKCLGSGVLVLDKYTFYQEKDGSLFFITVSEMKMATDRQMFERIAEKAKVDI